MCKVRAEHESVTQAAWQVSVRKAGTWGGRDSGREREAMTVGLACPEARERGRRGERERKLRPGPKSQHDHAVCVRSYYLLRTIQSVPLARAKLDSHEKMWGN